MLWNGVDSMTENIFYIFLILTSIFYKKSEKIYNSTIGKNNPRNWHFKNKKIDITIRNILNIITFLIGTFGLIYSLFLKA